jgi:Restriction endonuclease
MKVSENSEGYEKLAKKIYEDILALEGVENINVQHDVKVKGKSGVDHQIDVFWEYRYAEITHKVLIECKHYGHSVGLIHVRNMHGLLTDIPNSSGILVTTLGFQSGAQEYANFYEISLKIIRKPEGTDWDGCIQIVNIEMQISQNRYTDFKLEFDGTNEATKAIIDSDNSVMSIKSTDIIIRDSGHYSCPLNIWLDRNIPVDLEKLNIDLEKAIEPKESYLLISGGRELKIKKIQASYKSYEFTNSFEIDAMKLVEAVLEDCKTGHIDHFHKK